MTAAVYNNTTVITKVREALCWPGSDKVVDDDQIEEFILMHIDQESSFTFTRYMTGIYRCDLARGAMIYNLTFTGEDNITYSTYPTGTIKVTDGTATATTITATGCHCNFKHVMVDVLHWLATNRSIEAGVSVPVGTYTPRTAGEILDMASVWEGITNG